MKLLVGSFADIKNVISIMYNLLLSLYNIPEIYIIY